MCVEFLLISKDCSCSWEGMRLVGIYLFVALSAFWNACVSAKYVVKEFEKRM